jgi:hypothetical protein
MRIQTREIGMAAGSDALVGRGRSADRRWAAKHRVASGPQVVALRLAQADDAGVLRLLAELDEEPELTGDALLALIDGEAVAAISLDDGRVVANPFVATSDATSLLKLRGHQLSGVSVRKRPRLTR